MSTLLSILVMTCCPGSTSQHNFPRAIADNTAGAPVLPHRVAGPMCWFCATLERPRKVHEHLVVCSRCHAQGEGPARFIGGHAPTGTCTLCQENGPCRDGLCEDCWLMRIWSGYHPVGECILVYPFSPKVPRNAVHVLAWETATAGINTTLTSDNVFLFCIRYMEQRYPAAAAAVRVLDTQFFERLSQVRRANNGPRTHTNKPCRNSSTSAM